MAVRKEQSTMARQEPVKKNGSRRTTKPHAEIETISRPLVPAAPTPKAQPAPAGAPSANAASPTEEEIRRRAYELYLSRGQTAGDPEEDWFRAEQELRNRPGRPISSPGF